MNGKKKCSYSNKCIGNKDVILVEYAIDYLKQCGYEITPKIDSRMVFIVFLLASIFSITSVNAIGYGYGDSNNYGFNQNEDSITSVINQDINLTLVNETYLNTIYLRRDNGNSPSASINWATNGIYNLGTSRFNDGTRIELGEPETYIGVELVTDGLITYKGGVANSTHEARGLAFEAGDNLAFNESAGGSLFYQAGNVGSGMVGDGGTITAFAGQGRGVGYSGGSIVYNVPISAEGATNGKIQMMSYGDIQLIDSNTGKAFIVNSSGAFSEMLLYENYSRVCTATNGICITTTGNPFNQNLNTTDNVTFSSINITDNNVQAFNIQNSSGYISLSVNAQNGRMGIGQSPSSSNFLIQGNKNNMLRLVDLTDNQLVAQNLVNTFRINQNLVWTGAGRTQTNAHSMLATISNDAHRTVSGANDYYMAERVQISRNSTYRNNISESFLINKFWLLSDSGEYAPSGINQQDRFVVVNGFLNGISPVMNGTNGANITYGIDLLRFDTGSINFNEVMTNKPNYPVNVIKFVLTSSNTINSSQNMTLTYLPCDIMGFNKSYCIYANETSYLSYHAGNFGIGQGMNNPTNKLQVNGTVLFLNDTNTTGISYANQIGTNTSRVNNLFVTNATISNLTTGDIIFSNGMYLREPNQNQVCLYNATGGLSGCFNNDGTVQLPMINAEPTCNETYRGRQIFVKGGVGVADTEKVCVKGVLDTYGWSSLL